MFGALETVPWSENEEQIFVSCLEELHLPDNASALILQRGLSNRSVNVSNDCLKLMKDQWLSNCCQGDPIEFFKYLDVETYESVAESALEVLLSEGLVMPTNDKSIQQYILSADGQDSDVNDFAEKNFSCNNFLLC